MEEDEKQCISHDYDKNTETANNLFLNNIENEIPNDNRKELFEKFEIKFDNGNKRWGIGYQWFCKKCNEPCIISEMWFPCKKSFIITKVMCHLGCRNFWRLKIDLTDIKNKEIIN